MNIPNELMYTNDHEWAKIEDKIITIGVTDFAQGELGDIIFVELPEVGSVVEKEEAFGTIEAVKTVSDLLSPINGKIIEINDEIVDSPELVNEDCYGKGWFVKIEMSDPSEKDSFLSAEDYQEIIE